MFKICGNKGFHIQFKNGVIVSVQFGAGNYITGRPVDFYNREPRESIDAEIAVMDRNGSWLTRQMVDEEIGDDVVGWQSPEQFLAICNRAAAWIPDPK